MLNKIFYKTYNPLSGVEVEGGLCSPLLVVLLTDGPGFLGVLDFAFH